MGSLPAAHIALGQQGEDIAAAHLRRDGMRILQRNWRVNAGELDIIAQHGATTVFCEVKTRRSLRGGTPMEAIDDTKASRIKRLAGLWRRQWRRTGQTRFDVVCVVIHGGAALLEHRRGVL